MTANYSYTGDFSNDLREGEGIFVYKDGGKYEGSYKGGKKEGAVNGRQSDDTRGDAIENGNQTRGGQQRNNSTSYIGEN